MGIVFSSSQLDGAVSAAIPSTTYAYYATNTVSFGVSVSAAADAPWVFGDVTPYLVQPNPASPTITCTPFSVGVPATLECPIAGTAMDAGLFTISFSQYGSTTSLVPYDSTVTTYVIEPTSLSDVPGAVTFSIDKPLSTFTTTDTVTVSATTTSGISEIIPTETDFVPSSYTTVTAYYTTIVSTVVSSDISSRRALTTVTAACPPKPLKCSHNNCYRGVFTHSIEASAFCGIYTTGGIVASLPTYVSKCSAKPASISSACSCVFPSQSAMAARGIIFVPPPAYGPPDAFYTPGQFDVTTTTVTDSFAVPSSVFTDPPVTISSGVSTSTVYIDSTVTITTVFSDVAQTFYSTITKPAKHC